MWWLLWEPVEKQSYYRHHLVSKGTRSSKRSVQETLPSAYKVETNLKTDDALCNIFATFINAKHDI